MLNSHFASCFSKCHQLPDFIYTSHISSIPHLSSIFCTSEEDTSLTTSMKTKTASGPDGICSQMLKGVASSISNHLCLIYLYHWVLIHLTGGLPSLLLCSKLVTQNGPQKTIGQFPCYAKLLETIIHSKLMVYLLENNLLSTWIQTLELHPGSSTQEAILSATNDWYLTLTSKQELFVFFDLSKAFDTLPHCNILSVGVFP